jgi:hypothetical protein
MYPAATNDVVVDTEIENVADDDDVLQTVIVLTTVPVAAGVVYNVSAVPITPEEAIAPSRLIVVVAICYMPPSIRMSA